MILKFLRLLKIFTVATKYGLDEIAMSGFNAPRTARLVSGMFFWRRRITTPRAIWRWKSWGRSLSSSARCCRPGAT